MPPTSSSSSAGGSSGSMSTVVADMATGWHVLRIRCYSAIKAAGNNKYIRSGNFNIGGHSWYITYYPSGYDDDSVGFMSLFLYLDEAATDHAVVNARLKFSLLDHQGKPDSAYSKDHGQIMSFKSAPAPVGWGYTRFLKTDAVWEGSKHFKHDRFIIRCDVTVFLAIRTEAATRQAVAVPPSDLHKALAELLSKGEGADVTFDVDGELFPAHRNVLGARSSVFKAELFGSMKEKMAAPVVIRDMESYVFKALLHFIYTDSLPAMEAGEEIVMAQHLLVAADRYDLKRLKSICENKLCGRVTKRTAMTTLVLAEQHGCRGLKEACFAYLLSLGSLKAVMDTDGYDHLRSSCPSLHDELIAKLDVSKRTKKD
ncbi:hypothetical protein SETIT_8G197500v2 [Setaria italica]|uniref:BTB domain-containing protein n=3 Tax=Setaria italica TaxID=4555 RepID=A0A368S9J3_SETIT|nr:hypothetical protein SETIT_8G197500v2 [Setaria italica]